MDKKLCWCDRVECLMDQLSEQLNAIKDIDSRKWGIYKVNLKMFYKMYIKSQLAYSSTYVWGLCRSYTHQETEALRINLGCTKTLPSMLWK